jgi:hypothetical protein
MVRASAAGKVVRARYIECMLLRPKSSSAHSTGPTADHACSQAPPCQKTRIRQSLRNAVLSWHASGALTLPPNWQSGVGFTQTAFDFAFTGGTLQVPPTSSCPVIVLPCSSTAASGTDTPGAGALPSRKFGARFGKPSWPATLSATAPHNRSWCASVGMSWWCGNVRARRTARYASCSDHSCRSHLWRHDLQLWGPTIRRQGFERRKLDTNVKDGRANDKRSLPRPEAGDPL